MQEVLSTAQSSVDFALFVFSHQNLSDTLYERVRNQGVQIRGLIDTGFINREYSEALDMWGLEMPNTNCQIERNNHPWPTPIRSLGTPSLPYGDKLHHKFAVIDNSRVITGSHNWSESAELKNDETVLVIDSPAIASAYTEEFNHLAGKGTRWGPSPKLLQAIRERNAECRL
jgi:phosphatidylserine/phosphatidylglycerophosphate/cardiolipin synthase-like enzyme